MSAVWVLPKVAKTLHEHRFVITTHYAGKPRPGLYQPRIEARGLPPAIGQIGDAGDDRADAPASPRLDTRGTDLSVGGVRTDRFTLFFSAQAGRRADAETDKTS